MPSSSPDRPDLKSINAKLFADLDPNGIKDYAYLERIQQNCVSQVNPFACYITIMLGKEPKVIWSHKTGSHFGLVDMTFDDLVGLVHPSWMFTYLNYGRVLYEVAFMHRDLFKQDGAAAARLVPLRHRSGKYYWYHQISIKVADDGDYVAAHLNYYHQSAPYEGQLPDMPQMTTNGEVNTVATKEINQRALAFLPTFLEQFLSETQVKFMLQYRKIVAERGEKKLVQGELLELIDEVKTIDNLSKLKQRIGVNVKAFFGHPSLTSAKALAVWLNRYFPLQQD